MARAYRSAELWQQLIQLWQQSDMSIGEFCQQHELTASNF